MASVEVLSYFDCRNVAMEGTSESEFKMTVDDMVKLMETGKPIATVIVDRTVDFDGDSMLELDVQTTLNDIVERLVELEIEIFPPCAAEEAEVDLPELKTPAMDTEVNVKDLLDRVVERLAQRAEEEMAEFAVEFKSIATDTEDLAVELKTSSTDTVDLQVEFKNSSNDTVDLAIEFKTASTNTVHLVVDVTSCATDTNDLQLRPSSLDAETITDNVEVVLPECREAGTSCDVEMKDEETSMDDFVGKLMIDIGVATADEVGGIGEKSENDGLELVETVVELNAQDEVGQSDSLEFHDLLDLDVPFYPNNKTRRVGADAGASTTGNGTPNEPTFRRKTPVAASSVGNTGSAAKKSATIYGLKNVKKPSMGQRQGTAETPIADCAEDQENVGSDGPRSALPYLRLGLSKRARALKPLHTNVQLKEEEEPEEAVGADDEDEED